MLGYTALRTQQYLRIKAFLHAGDFSKAARMPDLPSGGAVGSRLISID
jgi:hypothetical protein